VELVTKIYYVALSCVAGSYDVYAQAPIDPNDGFCELAIGLGGTVVGGEYPYLNCVPVLV
jgi:hypothetical protein